jgi:hypothetical protein
VALVNHLLGAEPVIKVMTMLAASAKVIKIS